MTMAEIIIHRRHLREAEATRRYHRLLASTFTGVLVLAVAYVALIILS